MSPLLSHFLLATALCGACAASEPALADFPSVPHGPFTLLRPTPAHLMREFETDRPDTTESPRTVPAGHFQAEISFLDFTRDDSDGGSGASDLFGSMNLKLGLLDQVDLQVVFDAFTEERVTEGGKRTTTEGFGDVVTRLKVNLWGNDEGRTALALFPYVKFPTGTNLSNDQYEGGLILPFSMDLDDRHSLGFMVQTDFVHDGSTDGYDVEVLHSAVLGTALGERLGNYLEYVGVTGSDYRSLFSGGFTFSPKDNVQYDLGIRVGLNQAAEDFGIFSGVSFRY